MKTLPNLLETIWWVSFQKHTLPPAIHTHTHTHTHTHISSYKNRIGLSILYFSFSCSTIFQFILITFLVSVHQYTYLFKDCITMNFMNVPYIINLFEQFPLLDISFSVINYATLKFIYIHLCVFGRVFL